MSADIPRIETERLVLTGPSREDFDDSAAMWGDPEVTRYIGGKPFSREETWSKLCRNVGHWVLMGFGYWVARDRSGAFVGEVGFGEWKREITPRLDAPEAGWVLTPRAQGKGYATEAVRAALAWGERRFGNPRSVCIIDPGNRASVRVAEKCGFVPQPGGIYKGNPTAIFARGR